MFFSLLSLKYLYISFFYICLSVLSLSAAVCPLRSPPPLPRREAIRAPLSSLPVFRLSSAPAVCCVFRGSFRVPVFCVCAPEALWRPSACRAVCRAACPSLVCCQAQNGVTVWADAPRICPRPCPLFMCRRVFRCPFRVLSCGFLPCVRVCVLLPCVVWW